MTAHELVMYTRGASKRSVTHAWMTARFAMEGMSKRGLRSLKHVLEPYEGAAGTGGNGYDEDAADEWVRSMIGAHNARVAAGEEA